MDVIELIPCPSALASYLGVTSPPSPGIIGVLRDVDEELLAPKGNLVSKGVESEAEEVAGRLLAAEPQPLVECNASCSRSMPESFHGLR